jgi:hypothetical protein
VFSSVFLTFVSVEVLCVWAQCLRNATACVLGGGGGGKGHGFSKRYRVTLLWLCSAACDCNKVTSSLRTLGYSTWLHHDQRCRHLCSQNVAFEWLEILLNIRRPRVQLSISTLVFLAGNCRISAQSLIDSNLSKPRPLPTNRSQLVVHNRLLNRHTCILQLRQRRYTRKESKSLSLFQY